MIHEKKSHRISSEGVGVDWTNKVQKQTSDEA